MSRQKGFAVWITGIPASGKSTITRELVKKLGERSLAAIVLESDEMRRILTPAADYSPEERDAFYHSLALIGELITRSGVNVIFDATANRQSYRDFARSRIPHFIEVYVECPLAVCVKRDPKGLYRRAAAGKAGSLPGIQASYEPPVNAEVILDCRADPERGAAVIMDKLHQTLSI